MMTTRLPEEFLTQIKDLLGDNEANLLAEALEQEPSVAIRTNTRKPCTLPQWADSCHKVAWSINGRYLDERPQFTFTPQLHAGGFYVQDASSMIHELILKQIAPEHPIIDKLSDRISNMDAIKDNIEAANIAIDESARGISNVSELSVSITSSVSDIQTQANGNMDIANLLNQEVNRFKL